MKTYSFFALAACAVATSPAFAVDGDLDPTFGNNAGYTFLGFTGLDFQLPMRTTVLADGRILTCGGFATSSSQDDFVVAIATDAPDRLPHETLRPVLDLNDPDTVAQWLVDNGDRFEYRPEIYT